MELYERVLEIIKRNDLTPYQLEQKCGFSNGTIKRWKNHSPNIESIIQVAQILNVSIDYLVYGSSSNISHRIFTNKQDLFNRLIKLLEAQNITVKQFEKNCGLSNATIRRWKDHTPNLESIIKVSQQLNISIDNLVFGDDTNCGVDSKKESHNMVLNENEFDLITMYRYLQEQKQESIYAFVQMLYDQEARKKESTYSTYTEENTSSDCTTKAIDIA